MLPLTSFDTRFGGCTIRTPILLKGRRLLQGRAWPTRCVFLLRSMHTYFPQSSTFRQNPTLSTSSIFSCPFLLYSPSGTCRFTSRVVEHLLCILHGPVNIGFRICSKAGNILPAQLTSVSLVREYEVYPQPASTKPWSLSGERGRKVCESRLRILINVSDLAWNL